MQPLISNTTVIAVMQVLVLVGAIASIVEPWLARWPLAYAIAARLAGLGGDVRKVASPPPPAPPPSPPEPPAVPPIVTMIFGVLAALVVLTVASQLVGCASARDTAVATVNAAGDFGELAERTLEQLARDEQEAAIATAPTLAEAKERVLAIQARYHAAWVAYRDYRAAWLVAAAGVRAFDSASAAHQTPDVARLLALVTSLAEAEQAFAAAAAQIKRLKGHF